MNAQSESQPAGKRPKKQRTVLMLVDDDPNVCSALSRLFRPHGFSVLIAHDAASALTTLESHPHVDIIITDMRMPGKSGAELLKEVSASHPEICRILLTGYADLSETTRAIRSGLVDHFMTKPWEIDQIERCVLEAGKKRPTTH